MTLNALNAFRAGVQDRRDQEDRRQRNALMLEDQGRQNTAGKVNAFLMTGDRDSARDIAIGSGDADIMSGFQQRVAQMDERQRDQAMRGMRVLAGLGQSVLQAGPENFQQAYGRAMEMAQGMGIDTRQLPVARSPQELEMFVQGVMSMDEELYRSNNEAYTLGEGDTRVGPTGRQTIGQAGVEARGLERFANETARIVANRPTTPLVNVNTGDGNPDAFTVARDRVENEALTGLLAVGDEAARNLSRVNRLEYLLNSTPQGLRGGMVSIAGDLGLNVDGASEVQAAEALISAMVPAQRPAGSGQMSDADLDLFRRSLPRIMNQPDGNRVILETIRQINLYDRQAADIVRTSQNAAEARERLGQMQNPLARFSVSESQTQGYPEGTVIQNSQGEQRVMRGGRWVPVEN